MTYLIDTNIIVHFVRASMTYERLEKSIPLFSNNLDVYFSEVSVGEILSISQRNRWGNKKIERMEAVLDALTLIPISYADIYRAYATIDAYSQSHHPTLSLPQGMTARNMGKNDVWIAATAYVLRATLVTTDKDFDHLQHFFGLEWVEQ